MNTHWPSKLMHGLAVSCLLLMALAYPVALQAQSCTGASPARYIPENLWITDSTGQVQFRPGETGSADRRIPADRDSSGWDSLTIPGFSSGHEIFQSLDVAGGFVYVAYNAGFSIWDARGANAENPVRLKVRDGWHFSSCQSNEDCGPFLSFPGAGEVDFLVEDIDVIPASGPFVYIAVSGRNPVGISLWRFNTNSRELQPIYQDTTLVSRQVRWINFGGTFYVFSSYGNGLAVYDMNRALALGTCLEEDGSDCPGVYRGNLGDITTGRYLDLMLRPTGELLVSASNGNLNGQGLEIWQVNDPSNPAGALRLFEGLDNRTFGTALFAYEGNDYLAALEREGSFNVIKIFNISNCGAASCVLGAPVFDDVRVPPRLSDQFLTFSRNNGNPYLYHGLFGGINGPQVEQLLDLTTLGRTGQNITEVTDGGPTYFDNCVEQNLDYWAWYYPGNEFGPKNQSPRVGKFDPSTGYFYRAAGGVFDVHRMEAPEIPMPTITVQVSTPDPEELYWMTDDITFEASGSNGCDPGGIWNWNASTPSEVDAVLVSEEGNRATFRFECTTSNRCSGTVVSVSATNSDTSCEESTLVGAFLTVKDPRIEIRSIMPTSGTFTQCADVDFTAFVVGRGPVNLNWAVRRDPALDPEQIPQQTFEGTVTEEDLSTATPTFTWVTADAVFAGIFADGFESGDVSAWGLPPALDENFTIEAELGAGANAGEAGQSRMVTVQLSSISGDPTFASPPIEFSTEDNSTFNFTANTVPATVSRWFWEMEDDDGANLCTFGDDTNVPCTWLTGPEVTHTWFFQNGERRVDLNIGNCQSGASKQASTAVTVVSTEPLEITNFALDRTQSANACDIDFDCINQLVCRCLNNQTIFFELAATGGPDVYDFDWDGNGTFEDQGVPATGTEFTHVYPQAIGEVQPAVQARKGAVTSDAADLLETLDIVDNTEPLSLTSFKLDRAQSENSCEIDFDCITDLLCVCFVDETIFFEVTSTGNPDVYDFDWDGNGTFEDTNNNANGTTFTFTYPVALGATKPAVRARRGAATPVERDLLETLDIQNNSQESVSVTSFQLDRVASADACEIDFDCINNLTCTCFVGETVVVRVTSTGNPDFYDFDWDDNGSFEDGGNPTGGTTFTNVYSQAIGLTRPTVRARRGASISQRDLLETLNIQVQGPDGLEVTSFELDRSQSADSCDIDFDCITDLICVCRTNETIFFEVLATGDPDFYDFDWDGNGSFEDTSNPATGTEFTNVYTTALGQIMPAVRARKGAATPSERDLRETLDIQP